MAKLTPSAEYLNSILTYDPDSGKLFWKYRSTLCKTWNTRFAGKPFGSLDSLGRIFGRIDGEGFKAHRLIWKMIYDEDADEIDHINGNPADNRLQNLRNVCRTINMQNVKRRSDNQSGVTGVDWHKQTGKWRVRVRSKSFGLYDSFETACKVRYEQQEIAGFHENHGRNAHDYS